MLLKKNPRSASLKKCTVSVASGEASTSKGTYSRHATECMLVIDLDGNMAGKGTDEVSDYTVSGLIESDGTFKFDKQYVGPTSHHLVIS